MQQLRDPRRATQLGQVRLRPTQSPASLAGLPLLIALAACTATPSALATSSPSPSPSAVLATPAPTVAPSGSPPPSPEPPLSLALPDERDGRQLRVAVAPQVPPTTGGEISVTITNLADSRIDEIVLRWPTELAATLVLAPFVPSNDRIREGGPPLVQDWTKWVEGPGERGEPAGTTSLGYGPMDPGMTLTVPLYVTRNAPGPVAFDLQLLAARALLSLEGGAPAEVRVEVP